MGDQWLKTHQQKMLEHFLYLRTRDRDYALAALKAYESELLYPTIREELKSAWSALQSDKDGTKIKG
jgi:hypothetical protein